MFVVRPWSDGFRAFLWPCTSKKTNKIKIIVKMFGYYNQTAVYL